MIRFATLGPAGSNHQFVVERYLAFHGLRDCATISLHSDFSAGAASVLDGSADFLVQCAVHPSTADTVARYFDGLYVVDTFISPSRDLAIVHNRAKPQSRSIAVMQPTLRYADLSKWQEIIPTETVAAVELGLLEGRYDAGLTYASLADDHPDRFCISEHIGSVDDAWIVYGRQRVSGGGLVACSSSPATAIFRLMSGASG
ncbi:hypothetical protein [Variovorax paradoxus]|uniref:hypothetical protein n=1 Tax=Variovorax paradoxus TaxID=34073 RepID=UPI0029C91967|nr:hypothetical protein RZE77_24950 [Variovorax paradoxus]